VAASQHVFVQKRQWAYYCEI